MPCVAARQRQRSPRSRTASQVYLFVSSEASAMSCPRRRASSACSGRSSKRMLSNTIVGVMPDPRAAASPNAQPASKESNAASCAAPASAVSLRVCACSDWAAVRNCSQVGGLAPAANGAWSGIRAQIARYAAHSARPPFCCVVTFSLYKSPRCTAAHSHRQCQRAEALTACVIRARAPYQDEARIRSTCSRKTLRCRGRRRALSLWISHPATAMRARVLAWLLPHLKTTSGRATRNKHRRRAGHKGQQTH